MSSDPTPGAAVPGDPPADPPSAGGRPSALVVTVSTRAAAGVYPDQAGPVLVAGLTELGCATDGPRVVPDGEQVTRVLRDGIAHGYHLIVTSGGTGVTPADRTPEATLPLLDYEIPGIAERLRGYGVENGVPAAMLSRGRAGVAFGPGRATLVVNLAGSRGAARDGLAVLGSVLSHALDQLAGGDHR